MYIRIRQRIRSVLERFGLTSSAAFDPVEKRIQMTVSCRDCDSIPKVRDAGTLMRRANVETVQVMHEGSLVLAGGYHGKWMSTIIRRLRGHHEPQEELVFHHLLEHCRPGTLMIEIGAFWAYYTNWWLGRIPDSRAVCVEPDANNQSIGEKNLALNGRKARWISSMVGSRATAGIEYQRESDGERIEQKCHTLESLLEELDHPKVEMLHIDCQGAELGFLQSLDQVVARKLLRFVVVSTHHESISGSRTTHGDCLRLLLQAGGIILVEHTVDESFSGDGLIVASFDPTDSTLRFPTLSRNRACNSLFAFEKFPEEQVQLARTDNGPMIVSGQDNSIGKALLSQGYWEEDLIREVVGFLCNRHRFVPQNFVDIGANIGTHLLRALSEGVFLRGLGIEMESNNFNLLVGNVAINGYLDRTQLIHVALSDREEEGKFEFSNRNFGDHRLVSSQLNSSERFNAFGESERTTHTVRVTTLDRIAEEHTGYFSESTLIWMDVQGFEGHVLEGAQKLFSGHSRPCLVLELWPYGLERSDGLKKLIRFLGTCKAIYDIRGVDWVEKSLDLVEIEELVKKLRQSPDPGAHTDLLCIL